MVKGDSYHLEKIIIVMLLAILGIAGKSSFAFISVGAEVGAKAHSLSPQWKRVGMPEALYSHKAVFLHRGQSEYLYLIGGKVGRSKADAVYTGTVYFTKVDLEGYFAPFSTTRPLPQKMGDHGAVVVGDRIYVLGGWDESRSTFDQVYCAKPDPSGEILSWTQVGPMPMDLATHAVVVIGNTIFVLGGYSSSRGQMVQNVWAADAQGGDCAPLSWREELRLPGDRAAASAAAVQLDNGRKFIYVVGGMRRIGGGIKAYDQVWRAEVGGAGHIMSWKSLGDIGSASGGLYRSVAAIVGRYLYVIGGTVQGSDYLDTVYRARIQDDGSLGPWKALDRFPVAVAGHAVATSVAGRIYVLGGQTDSSVLVEGYFTPIMDLRKSIVMGGEVGYGGTITYALDLTNLGVRDLGSLTITDTVSSPVSVALQSLPDGCQSSGHAPLTITCTIPGLSLGESRFLTYSILIPSPPTADMTFVSHQDAIDGAAATLAPGQGGRPQQNVGLSIDKDADPIVIAGRKLTYTLRVRNGDLFRVQDVTVTDDLPDSVEFISSTLEDARTGTDPITWSLGSLWPGEERTIELVVAVPPDSSGTLVNVASVAGYISGYSISDQDEVQTAVIQQADLSIEKKDNPDPVMAGERLTYTLVITNAGPSDARDVSVTDFLPTELQVISTTPVTTSGPSPLEWRLDLPAGQSAEIQILASVAPNSTGTLQNIAMVSSDIDPSSGNNTAQEWTAIGSQADLRLQKVDEPDPVSPGGVLTYTLLITNEGPSEAINVVVTDTLPAEICQVNSQPAGCSGDPLVCDLGTMAAGATRKLQITATVCLTATGLLVNEAEVSSDVPDSDPTSNQAQASTATEPVADLRLTKSRETEVVIAGDVVTYVLRVTNEGPSIASDVVVSDWLPVNTTFVTATQPVTVQHSVTTATWYTPTLQPGQSWDLYLVVRTPPGSNGVMTNTARVASKTLDDYSENNSAVDTAYVYGLANLSIGKEGHPNPVDPGGVLTYTLWITNAGPSEALNVVVTDTLPPGICGWNGLPANCSGNPLVCTLGTIPAGEARSFSLSVTVCLTSTGVLVNEARVGSSIPDSDSTDNQVQERTTIGSRADLQITKSHNPMTATAGTLLTYTLVVTNDGPSDAEGLIVTMTVPFDTHLITTIPPAMVTSTSSITSVIWSTSGLLQGQRVQFQAVVLVDPGSREGLHNWAEVASNTPDDNFSNNRTPEEQNWVFVQKLADLRLKQESSADRVPLGGILRYLLQISNEGPSNAEGIVVTDTLPSGVSFPASTPSTPFPLDGPSLVWSRSSLKVGETWTIEITTVVNAQPGAILTNTACVDSATPSTLPLPACDETRAFVPAVVQNRAWVCEGGQWCKASNLSAVLINPLRVYMPVLLRNNR